MLIGAEVIRVQHMIDLNQRNKIGKEFLLNTQTISKIIKTNRAKSTVFLVVLNNLKACLLEEEVCRVVLQKECKKWDQGNYQIQGYK